MAPVQPAQAGSSVLNPNGPDPLRNNVNARTEFDPLIKLDDVRVMHPEAAVRNRPANRTRLVGAVYPVKGRPQIECPRTSGHPKGRSPRQLGATNGRCC